MFITQARPTVRPIHSVPLHSSSAIRQKRQTRIDKTLKLRRTRRRAGRVVDLEFDKWTLDR